MKFNLGEYHHLALQARKIQGRISCLQCLQTNQLSSQKIREICNDAYNEIDNFLILLEQLEKGRENESKKSLTKNNG